MTDQPETITTVVTKRSDAMLRSVTATTPADHPDVRVIAMPWWHIMLIRAARAYMAGVQGYLMVVAGTVMGVEQDVVRVPDHFWRLVADGLAVAAAPAVASMINNSVYLLKRLDERLPKWGA